MIKWKSYRQNLIKSNLNLLLTTLVKRDHRTLILDVKQTLKENQTELTNSNKLIEQKTLIKSQFK